MEASLSLGGESVVIVVERDEDDGAGGGEGLAMVKWYEGPTLI